MGVDLDLIAQFRSTLPKGISLVAFGFTSALGAFLVYSLHEEAKSLLGIIMPTRILREILPTRPAAEVKA